MPTPYPKEFRADVVAVARQGGKSRAQVARTFGISEFCLARWLRIFRAARHPRSFVSLKGADHLLTGRNRASRAARIISAWADPYLAP